jgi:hypothetical protein
VLQAIGTSSAARAAIMSIGFIEYFMTASGYCGFIVYLITGFTMAG